MSFFLPFPNGDDTSPSIWNRSAYINKWIMDWKSSGSVPPISVLISIRGLEFTCSELLHWIIVIMVRIPARHRLATFFKYSIGLILRGAYLPKSIKKKINDKKANKDEHNVKKDLTNGKTSIIVNIRCFACNRLLCTGHIEEGEIVIKCGKCGRYVTIGAHGAQPATVKTVKLVR